MKHNHSIELHQDKRLLTVMVMNLVIPLIQIYAGLVSGSMALMSDAIHNLSDFTSILISYIALKISHRPPDPKQTFGYKRVEVLAAIINISILFAASFFIIFESWKHLSSPKPIKGELVIWIASLAFLANAISTLLLHKGAKTNINIRSAFLHMLTDTLTSFGVIILGCIWLFYPWYWLDSFVAWIIVAIIIYNGWLILKEAVSILMNAVPSSLDIKLIKKKIETIEGVRSIHHLHIWKLSSDTIALSAHVIVPDQMLSKVEKLADKIRKMLFCDFDVAHPTLQFEINPYQPAELLCPQNQKAREMNIS